MNTSSTLKIAGVSSRGHAHSPNADCWGHTQNAAWVLDGATRPPGVRCCDFDTEHFVESIDRGLRRQAESHIDIRDMLVDALRSTKAEHAARHMGWAPPPGPAATAAVVRVESGWIEWAVLGDAGVVLGAPPRLVSDSRLAMVAVEERDSVRRDPASFNARIDLYKAELAARNRADGYWVLADDLEAPFQALRGTRPADGNVILTSDGVHRHIGPDGLWGTVVEFADAVRDHPPQEITAWIRRHERNTGMQPDDATLVVIDTADHPAPVG